MEQAITLAKGGRARAFPYVKKDESVLFFTGRSLTVRYEIKNEVLAIVPFIVERLNRILYSLTQPLPSKVDNFNTFKNAKKKITC